MRRRGGEAACIDDEAEYKRGDRAFQPCIDAWHAVRQNPSRPPNLRIRGHVNARVYWRLDPIAASDFVSRQIELSGLLE
jgi:hypothetical protein